MSRFFNCLIGCALLFTFLSGCNGKPAPDAKTQADEAVRLDKQVASGEGSL